MESTGTLYKHIKPQGKNMKPDCNYQGLAAWWLECNLTFWKSNLFKVICGVWYWKDPGNETFFFPLKNPNMRTIPHIPLFCYGLFLKKKNKVTARLSWISEGKSTPWGMFARSSNDSDLKHIGSLYPLAFPKMQSLKQWFHRVENDEISWGTLGQSEESLEVLKPLDFSEPLMC